MGDPFLFLDDDTDDHDDDNDDDAFEGGGVVSSSTMTMGRSGPPTGGNGEIVSPSSVENEVLGVGLSGRVIVG